MDCRSVAICGGGQPVGVSEQGEVAPSPPSVQAQMRQRCTMPTALPHSTLQGLHAASTGAGHLPRQTGPARGLPL